MLPASRPSLLDDLAHAAMRRAYAALKADTRSCCFLDATAGNGHDTVFLAEMLSSQNLLLACDIQEQALHNTLQRLSKHHFTAHTPQQSCILLHQQLTALLPQPLPPQTAAQQPTILLLHENHVALATHIQQSARPLGGALFNLGYLPGADKNITTQTNTTLQAVKLLLSALAPQGILALHCYTGHAGGMDEYQALHHLSISLPPREWRVFSGQDANRDRASEILLVLEKLPAKSQRPSLPSV